MIARTQAGQAQTVSWGMLRLRQQELASSLSNTRSQPNRQRLTQAKCQARCQRASRQLWCPCWRTTGAITTPRCKLTLKQFKRPRTRAWLARGENKASRNSCLTKLADQTARSNSQHQTLLASLRKGSFNRTKVPIRTTMWIGTTKHILPLLMLEMIWRVRTRVARQPLRSPSEIKIEV